MTTIECSGKKIKLDKDGFLADCEDWSEEVAKKMAALEGVGVLSDEKMEIVRFMRGYYAKFNAFPILQQVCKMVGQPRECVNDEFMNPEKAWKIAGLPKLDGIQFVAVEGSGYRMEECC